MHAPLFFPNYAQKQRGTQKKRRNTLIPKKAHNVQTVTQIKAHQQANLNSTRSEKSLQTTVAHVPSSFIFSHHTLLLHCHSPFMVRERLSCCDSSTRELHWHCHSERGELRDLALTQHASLISWRRRSIAMWQLHATRPSSQSSRKRETTSLDQFCPTTSRARLSTLCSYSSKKTYPRFLPNHRRRCSKLFFLGNHTSIVRNHAP